MTEITERQWEVCRKVDNLLQLGRAADVTADDLEDLLWIIDVLSSRNAELGEYVDYLERKRIEWQEYAEGRPVNSQENTEVAHVSGVDSEK